MAVPSQKVTIPLIMKKVSILAINTMRQNMLTFMIVMPLMENLGIRKTLPILMDMA